jgi:RNA polymerase sigma-70 factor (ECF subfamily)
MADRTKPDDAPFAPREEAALPLVAAARPEAREAREAREDRGAHEASAARRADAPDEDAALVEAARRGDQAAFTRLFERHHGRVYAMCARLLQNPAEVEDAVQQAFLEAWRSLYRFEGRSRFSTWITRIAIHTCLGFRRRLRRLFLLEDTVPGREDASATWTRAPTTPDEGAAERARKRALDEVLWRLSPRKRVVFVLADLEGMTAPEIARVLDIPDATVRTRLFHARKELARLVRRHPGFADLFESGPLAAPQHPDESPGREPAGGDE